MPTYLLTLATGQQARLTAKHLLAAGATVHAVVRDPTSQAARNLASAGVKLFKGNLDEPDVFRKAAEGCTGVFLNLVPASPPTPSATSTSDPANTNPSASIVDSERQRAASILAACHDAGVKYVVASTAIYTGDRHLWDTPEAEAIGYHYSRSKAGIEDAVRSSGLSGGWTILRPGWIMSNYLVPVSPFVYPELPVEGLLKHSYESGAGFEHVDEEDVGKYAAAALLEPERFVGREITLASGWLSVEDVAAEMSRVSGREVKVSKRTAEEQKEAVRKGNLALEFELWASLVGDKVHEARWKAKGSKPPEEEFGIPLTGFEEYLQREKEVLLRSLPTV
ncbi:hypothetical protein RJZ56_001525 [Blastomyces dermatitidis]|uniref:NmrA family protein n=1 Tax=Ajellomyces dermatitidis (strain ATCC 18188 / CBS 674.68) TaxID=653446 RepID=F2T431_AJEDA|nr:NmrA family protein [Blastomyces dermatitidis ATCC 18188]EQL32668.1 hypothetical protein BDFG_05209 [Blastomyces dermatitidis ATCC 26199]